MEIINPWFIMHQPGGQGAPMECIVAGPEGASHRKFGMAIADLIRHVAKAKNVDESDVFEWVRREMDRPTTDVIRTGPN